MQGAFDHLGRKSSFICQHRPVQMQACSLRYQVVGSCGTKKPVLRHNCASRLLQMLPLGRVLQMLQCPRTKAYFLSINHPYTAIVFLNGYNRSWGAHPRGLPQPLPGLLSWTPQPQQQWPASRPRYWNLSSSYKRPKAQKLKAGRARRYDRL